MHKGDTTCATAPGHVKETELVSATALSGSQTSFIGLGGNNGKGEMKIGE